MFQTGFNSRDSSEVLGGSGRSAPDSVAQHSLHVQIKVRQSVAARGGFGSHPGVHAADAITRSDMDEAPLEPNFAEEIQFLPSTSAHETEARR